MLLAVPNRLLALPVRNIYTYYIAYKLIEDAEAAKQAAIPTPG